MNCVNCGKTLTGRQTKFCCRKCKNDHNNPIYQDYKTQCTRAEHKIGLLKKALGERCSVCGSTTGLLIVGIDKRLGANSSVKKLMTESRLLCQSCLKLHE